MNYTKNLTHQKELYTNMYIKMSLSRSGSTSIHHLQSSSSSSGSGLDLKTQHQCHLRLVQEDRSEVSPALDPPNIRFAAPESRSDSASKVWKKSSSTKTT